MPEFLPPKVIGVQQRPLYLRVRSILIFLSTLWLISAVIGIGFFSGGTTSLAFSLILLYGTGAALLIVISALYRVLSKAARQRVEMVPDDRPAAVFVDTARSATEEIMAALRPAAVHGRPVAVRMPQTVDAVDVAAALAVRTAAMTSAAAAEEKAAAAGAAMVAGGKPAGGQAVPGKSAVNKAAVKKKNGSKQPAQPTKARAGKSRPAGAPGTRGTGNQASTAPKKSTGGKKPGTAGKSAAGGKDAKKDASTAESAGPSEAVSSVMPAHPALDRTPLMEQGIRTAQQDILPRLAGAPSCGLPARPVRTVAADARQLIPA